MIRKKVKYDISMNQICEEHYERGPIVCCPFPACPNGTDADEVEVTGPHLPTEVYQRFAWGLPGGETCYSWRKPQRPLVSQLKRVLSREAGRSGLTERYSAARKQIIYHYTSPEGLLGIVEKNEVWMSDYSFLNDAEELTYGLALAKSGFEKAAEKLPDAADLLKKMGNPCDLSDLRACVGSFSLVGDSLSQWRAYGSLAIAFQVGSLMFGYNNSVRMDRVIYDPEIQKRLIDLYAHLAASSYADDRNTKDAAGLEMMYNRGGESLLEMTAFFKHPTFADEHEARIVHIEDRKVYDHLKIERPPYRFRTSGGMLIPYVTTRDVVTLPGRYPDKLPIVGVIIGPSRHADVLQRGVERLLVAHGYESVRITRSTAPLRS